MMTGIAPRIIAKLGPKVKQLFLFRNPCKTCKGTGKYTYINFRFQEATINCPLCKGAGFKD